MFKDGTTPLIMAAQNGHKEIVECLLKAGANPNHHDTKVCCTYLLCMLSEHM